MVFSFQSICDQTNAMLVFNQKMVLTKNLLKFDDRFTNQKNLLRIFKDQKRNRWEWFEKSLFVSITISVTAKICFNVRKNC
jgi:hypothetical protein